MFGTEQARIRRAAHRWAGRCALLVVLAAVCTGVASGEGQEFLDAYAFVEPSLTEAGHEVPTAHLAESGIPAKEAVIDPLEVYARDVAWIRNCDVLIAEVSVPSHGVGYENGFSLGLGKPVLALYQEDRKVSKMISGNPDSNLTVKAYQSPENAINQIREFLSDHLINL